MGINGAATSSLFELNNYSALALWDGPLGVIKNLRNGDKIKINEYGYQSPEKLHTNPQEIINEANGKMRVEIHHKSMRYNLIDAQVVILHKIMDVLKKRGIKNNFHNNTCL